MTNIKLLQINFVLLVGPTHVQSDYYEDNNEVQKTKSCDDDEQWNRTNQGFFTASLDSSVTTEQINDCAIE